MLQSAVVTIMTLTALIKAEEQGAYFEVEENHFLVNGNTIWNGTVRSLFSCSQMCARQAACTRANFITSQQMCFLFGEKETSHSEKRLQLHGSFYLKKVCYLPM